MCCYRCVSGDTSVYTVSLCSCIYFVVKQQTACELRISDWSSDVCSSDLVRLVQVEYSQDWWAEAAAQNDAGWRGNPRVAGPAGTLGDVGTHAYQLACYVSGMRPVQIAADLRTFIEGRLLDDHVQVMMR